MRRFVKPAFVLTVVSCGEAQPPKTELIANPPQVIGSVLPEPEAPNSAAPAASGAASSDAPDSPGSTASAAANPAADGSKRRGHPHDAQGRPILRADDVCYVEVPRKGPPPKDLMSGERWVANQEIACPKEFEDRAFNAIPPGTIWVKDDKTGACAHRRLYGNPPPPDVAAPCPPPLK